MLLEFRHPLTQKFTMVTLMHPLTQEFTTVLRAGDSQPAIRKAPGAVKGGSRGRMTGVSPALPETKARNGAEPLTTRTNYKYHTTKVIKKIQTKKHISN